MRLGARLINRDEFLDQLEEALNKPTDLGSWSEWSRYI
jgi:hypothetical protein